MDGEILVESEVGKGTEFTVILPMRNEAKVVNSTDFEINPVVENIIGKSNVAFQVVDSNNSEIVIQPTSKPQILLIEDNPDVVAYVASFLEKDFKIKVGNDDQEGIEIALNNIPDLIISDVMMPHKDGFEVCNTLKKDERTSHIPVIMLTAKADIQSKLEGLERGADAYLPKPFHKEDTSLILISTLKLCAKN